MIDQSPDLHEVFNTLLDHVISQLHIHAAAVFLYKPLIERLECAAVRGFRAKDIDLSGLSMSADRLKRAALDRQIIHISNLKEEPEASERTPLLESEEFISYYGVPLIAREQILGMLAVFHRAPLALDSESVTFLKVLADQAVLAINNAHLFDDLQRSNLALASAYEATLEGWVRALDLRDRETAGHTRRVTELTLRLARKMGIGGEQLVHIRRGALLHDIGKLGISDTILFKPSKLTEEELTLMNQHPALGYELLSPIPFLQPALDIVYCHHERWDGSGYPRGLKGEEIPLAARIFAVVDVWDALVADRMFRRGTPRNEAVAYIKDQAGKAFDAQVVDAFLALISD